MKRTWRSQQDGDAVIKDEEWRTDNCGKMEEGGRWEDGERRRKP
jgi:hypothetical protein